MSKEEIERKILDLKDCKNPYEQHLKLQEIIIEIYMRIGEKISKMKIHPLYLFPTEEGYPEYVVEIKDKLNEIIEYINSEEEKNNE